MFRDSDGDFLADDPLIVETTDASGAVPDLPGAGALVAAGGLDRVLGLDLRGLRLSAPESSEVISPLTTMLERSSLTQNDLKSLFLTEQSADLTLAADAQAGAVGVEAIETANDTLLIAFGVLQFVALEAAESSGAPITEEAALSQVISALEMLFELGLGLSSFNNMLQLVEGLNLPLPLENLMAVTD